VSKFGSSASSPALASSKDASGKSYSRDLAKLPESAHASRYCCEKLDDLKGIEEVELMLDLLKVVEAAVDIL
jgi:hypothetical protein